MSRRLIRHMRLSSLGLALSAALAGCTPVTLDNDPTFDFARWSVLYVAPIDGAGRSADQFLVTRLRDQAGFKRVVTEPSPDVNCILYVRVDVTEDYDSDGDVEYDAVARFRVESAFDGSVIDSGTASDDAGFYEEALEEALDDISLHYLRPYRL